MTEQGRILDGTERPLARGLSPRGRGVSRHRRTGGLAHADPDAVGKGLGGDDPQRHAGPGVLGPSRQPACLRGSGADADGPAPVRRRFAGGRRSRPRDREDRRHARRRTAPPMSGPAGPVGSALSAATQGASLVLAPKHEAPIKHIDFVPLASRQALVVLVFSDGHVENRMFNAAAGHTPARCARPRISSMRGRGPHRVELAKHLMAQEIETAARDRLACQFPDRKRSRALGKRRAQTERLIVRGRANLLSDSGKPWRTTASACCSTISNASATSPNSWN
jgi:hypothetical protein